MKTCGDWEQAKSLLQNLFIPAFAENSNENNKVVKDLADIMGYPVQLVRYTWEKRRPRSFVSLMNPNTNQCAVRDIEKDQPKGDKGIFD